MPSINVLKPFVFSLPGTNGKMAREHKFSVGEHEVSDEVANHPWIAESFADGHIETPKARAERTARAAAAADAAAKAAAKAKAAAEASVKRLEAANTNGQKTAAATDELNLPIGQVATNNGAGTGAKLGKDIDPNDPALHTPLSELQTDQEALDKAAQEKAAADAEVARAAELEKRVGPQTGDAAANVRATLGLRTK
jgi:hypothetical protein